MTFLELVNAVLRRLRQETVVATTLSEYATLIGLFVNESKREVEDSWNWSHLRDTINVTTTASVGSYSLTGSNARTRVLEAYNASAKMPLRHWRNNRVLNRESVLGGQEGSPMAYDFWGLDSSTQERVIRLSPIPSGTQTLTFFVCNPQNDLTDADELLVPSEPVVQGAYLRAIAERGEDVGQLSEIQSALYKTTLADAIALDASQYMDETTWQAS